MFFWRYAQTTILVPFLMRVSYSFAHEMDKETTYEYLTADTAFD